MRFKTYNLQTIQSKRENSFISFNADRDIKYGMIEQFFSKSVSRFATVNVLKLIKARKPKQSPINFFSFLEVEVGDEKCTIDVNNISPKLLNVNYFERMYVIPLLDVFEHDRTCSKV